MPPVEQSAEIATSSVIRTPSPGRTSQFTSTETTPAQSSTQAPMARTAFQSSLQQPATSDNSSPTLNAESMPVPVPDSTLFRSRLPSTANNLESLSVMIRHSQDDVATGMISIKGSAAEPPAGDSVLSAETTIAASRETTPTQFSSQAAKSRTAFQSIWQQPVTYSSSLTLNPIPLPIPVRDFTPVRSYSPSTANDLESPPAVIRDSRDDVAVGAISIEGSATELPVRPRVLTAEPAIAASRETTPTQFSSQTPKARTTYRGFLQQPVTNSSSLTLNPIPLPVPLPDSTPACSRSPSTSDNLESLSAMIGDSQDDITNRTISIKGSVAELSAGQSVPSTETAMATSRKTALTQSSLQTPRARTAFQRSLRQPVTYNSSLMLNPIPLPVPVPDSTPVHSYAPLTANGLESLPAMIHDSQDGVATGAISTEGSVAEIPVSVPSAQTTVTTSASAIMQLAGVTGPGALGKPVGGTARAALHMQSSTKVDLLKLFPKKPSGRMTERPSRVLSYSERLGSRPVLAQNTLELQGASVTKSLLGPSAELPTEVASETSTTLQSEPSQLSSGIDALHAGVSLPSTPSSQMEFSPAPSSQVPPFHAPSLQVTPSASVNPAGQGTSLRTLSSVNSAGQRMTRNLASSSVNSTGQGKNLRLSSGNSTGQRTNLASIPFESTGQGKSLGASFTFSSAFKPIPSVPSMERFAFRHPTTIGSIQQSGSSRPLPACPPMGNDAPQSNEALPDYNTLIRLMAANFDSMGAALQKNQEGTTKFLDELRANQEKLTLEIKEAVKQRPPSTSGHIVSIRSRRKAQTRISAVDEWKDNPKWLYFQVHLSYHVLVH